MRVLTALFLVVIVQAEAIGQANDESHQKQQMCATMAHRLLNLTFHAFSSTPETMPQVTGASIYGARYSADDSTCYMATEYQVRDNNQRDCSFLTLARVPFKNDADRPQMKVAETQWCRSNGSGQSDYTSTSPSDICHGGGSKESDYTCVQAFIKDSVAANK